MSSTEIAVPTDTASEAGVLGSLLFDRNAVVKVAGLISAADFYHTHHGLVFQAILDLYHRAEPPDLLTVKAELERRGHLALIGGPAALAGWMAGVPSAVHVEYYALNVQRAALQRELITAGGEIAGMGFDRNPDIQATLDRAVARLARVTTRQRGGAFEALEPVLDATLAGIYNRQAPRRGITTDWDILDRGTLGWHPGTLTLVCASTSVGKSTLALQWFRAALDCQIYDAVLKAHRPVRAGYVSVEMDKEPLTERLYALETLRLGRPVPLHKIRGAVCNAGELDILTEAYSRLGTLGSYILNAPHLSITELPAYVAAAQAKHGLDIVFVDYLQLLDAAGDTPQEAIRAIGLGLRGLARQLQIPIIALAQLNREADKAEVPTMAMIEGSGGPARDADLVFILYRPNKADPSTVMLDLQKHRNGPIGQILLEFDPESVSFWPKGGA